MNTYIYISYVYIYVCVCVFINTHTHFTHLNSLRVSCKPPSPLQISHVTHIHLTHMNELRHTHKRVTPRCTHLEYPGASYTPRSPVQISHITPMNGSCHTAHMNGLCHTHERVTSHHNTPRISSRVLQATFTRANKSCHANSCHTHARVMSNTWTSHVTRTNVSHHTHLESPRTSYAPHPPVQISHITHVNESCPTHEQVTWQHTYNFLARRTSHVHPCVPREATRTTHTTNCHITAVETVEHILAAVGRTVRRRARTRAVLARQIVPCNPDLSAIHKYGSIVCCGVLQRVVVCAGTSDCATLSTLVWNARIRVRCALQCIVVCCSVWQCRAVCYGTSDCAT